MGDVSRRRGGQKGKEKEKGKGEKGKKEKKKKREKKGREKRKSACSSRRRSDGRNSWNQELKSV